MAAFIEVFRYNSDYGFYLVFDCYEQAGFAMREIMKKGAFRTEPNCYRFKVSTDQKGQYGSVFSDLLFYADDCFPWVDFLTEIFDRKYKWAQIKLTNEATINNWETVAVAPTVARALKLWRGLGVYLASIFIKKKAVKPTTDTQTIGIFYHN
ncbi:hypothetical protein AB6805_29670 [Chitinophaga sp. RCC_12]|uniref:hypothetical protein n=1 Tax=Chitinophaga sp. RCC_12 TaxID=3239226 RepID=UPI003524BDE5